MHGWDRDEAARYVLSMSRISEAELREIPERDLQMEWAIRGPTQQIPFPEYAHPVDGRLPYLWKRGIRPEDAQACGLMWCSMGRYRNRLVFPVWEEGRLVYFQARAMWEPTLGEPFIKALNPPKTEGAAVSGEVLLNLDRARPHPHVADTQGGSDALKVGPDAVASFGKQLTAVQISKLQQAGVREVDLMWDADAGQEAWAEAPRLAQCFAVRICLPPTGDPGDHPPELNRIYRERGVPYAYVPKTRALS